MRIEKREFEAASISCERVLTHEAQAGDSDNKGEHQHPPKVWDARGAYTDSDTARLALLASGHDLRHSFVRPEAQLSVIGTRKYCERWLPARKYGGCSIPATGSLLPDTRFRSRSKLRDGGGHHSLTSAWQWGRLLVPGPGPAHQLAGCHLAIRDTRTGNYSRFAASGTTHGLVVTIAGVHLPSSWTFARAATAWYAPADDLPRWALPIAPLALYRVGDGHMDLPVQAGDTCLSDLLSWQPCRGHQSHGDQGHPGWPYCRGKCHSLDWAPRGPGSDQLHLCPLEAGREQRAPAVEVADVHGHSYHCERTSYS